jgi:hypothetical protein
VKVWAVMYEDWYEIARSLHMTRELAEKELQSYEYKEYMSIMEWEVEDADT